MNECKEREDLDLVYQLELWKKELECWVVGWKASVCGVPPMWLMSENWIPSLLSIGMSESAGSDNRVVAQEDESEDWKSEVED
ncbi:hypothetical protein PAXINDRAFT_7943 [Paxillus involutus ATCC 200175]|nr:hypothetical protein PAXINDRAFT_7943 [Paxillus involutus ATCC 200175]